MAGLEEDIKAMSMGMHAVISEGAETFSGGQKPSRTRTASTLSREEGWSRKERTESCSAETAHSSAWRSVRWSEPRSHSHEKSPLPLRQLNDDDVVWMLATGTRRFVPAGGTLIEQGVPVDAVFIFLEGKLAVWLKPRRGSEREIARLNAGEIVGEMSFVDAHPPSATVRALEDSTVFAISKAVLNAKPAPDQGCGGRCPRPGDRPG